MPGISMVYQEIEPPGCVAHLVLSFWEFKVEGEGIEPVMHETFPDGCISLLYKRNENFGISGLFISGLSLEPFKPQVFAGDILWGVRLTASACAKILRCNPAEISPHPLNGKSEFSHLTEDLPEKFAVCQSFDEAVKIFENKLLSLNMKPQDVDEKVAEAVKIIDEARGEIKIAAIADLLSLSTRQLERRFKQSAGLSPKQYLRARRFRATAVSLLEQENLNWANRAAEMGFTDQAHLSHEFSQLAGRSPKSFAERIKIIEHGKLIK